MTAANLAASFASTGRQTILVDADLRHPSIHTLFGVSRDVGLTSLLLNMRSGSASQEGDRAETESIKTGGLRKQLDLYLVNTDDPNLRVLPAGRSYENLGDLLGSAKMDQLLDAMKRAASVVLVDAPPLLDGADAAVLAAKGMDVLLVVNARATRGEPARMARQVVPATVTVLGVVLNRVSKVPTKYHSYHASEARQPVGHPLGNFDSSPFPKERIAG